jgi:tripartite-type tricarboxylate transporter receptor subunit TctC
MMKGKISRLTTPVFVVLLAMCLGAVTQGLAKEKPYPAREINMYIGAPPGGSLDISGRVIAKVLSNVLGQQVVVINKPGGTQSVSFSYVAGAKPDGYTLAYILNPYLISKKLEEPDMPYGVDKMTWLGSIYKFNFMLTVRTDSPWKTFEEFVAYAKTNPEKIIFGSDGAGGSQHILQLQFAEMAGFKPTYVPFAGGGPAVRALLGGHVNAVTISPGPTGPYVKSGELRYLADFAPRRNSLYPDVPTAKEKGLNLIGEGWTAFAAPKGLPEAIAQRLVKVLKETSQSKEVEAIFHKMGWEYDYRGPQECVDLWKEQEVMFGNEMKKLGMIK